MVATVIYQFPGLKPKLEPLLANWADWMRSGERPERLPDHAMGCYAEHSDFDGMCAQMDVVLAMTTHAVIDDLAPVQCCAIYHAYLAAVYRFRSPLEVVLVMAKQNVQTALERKGVWLGA